MNNYFNGVKNIEEAKKLYRKLAQKLHPDHGGNEEEFKSMQDDFEIFLKSFMASSFSTWEKEHGKEAKGNSFVFASILKSIIDFNIRIEIVGYWIYAFESFEVKDLLKEKGFWFSKKHKAWVYSGTSKGRFYSNKSLDQIKSIYGYQLIKDKESQKKVAYV